MFTDGSSDSFSYDTEKRWEAKDLHRYFQQPETISVPLQLQAKPVKAVKVMITQTNKDDPNLAKGKNNTLDTCISYIKLVGK